jgi:AhpD family alkylhydroperoxidase
MSTSMSTSMSTVMNAATHAPEPRIKNAVFLLPDVLPALLAVNKAASPEGLPIVTIKLIHLRASQINGCAVCCDMHARELKHEGVPDKNINTVAAWREAPWFTPQERAALALTEALTRLADRPDTVTDEIWNEAARLFEEKELMAIVVQISLINVFNRINCATRQIAGAWKG